MKNKFLIFALILPSICFADEMAVSAGFMDNPSGSRCKVVLSDYRPNSAAVYLGNCGWTGLKGIGAYVQAWNHSNHVKIVRGQFSSGRVEGYAKVTYINRLTNTVETYEESSYTIRNSNSYSLDGVLADARQSGLQFDSSVSAYIKFANYIDLRE
jgi:hypothetical protein